MLNRHYLAALTVLPICKNLIVNKITISVLCGLKQPDLIGHAYGPDSEQVNETLPTTSRTIDYLLDMIEDHGLKDNLNVIITR